MGKLRIAGLIALAISASMLSWVSGLLHAATHPTAASAQEAEEKTRFLRLVEDAEAGARLEAAEVIYQNEQGATVRLVSAVHIGEQAYYDAVSRNFEQDDAVLYEMIKPRGMPAPLRGQHNDHSIATLQQFLRDKLALEYQLDAIDYRRPNFVHADLDAETFWGLQKERKESMASLMMQSMMDSISRGKGGGGDSPSQLIALLAQPDPERQMKLMLAREMHDLEAVAMGLDGPNGSVILSERNKRAIEVLERALGEGKQKISIFYGAAHMPDLGRRVEALGFKPVETRWQLAWDVTVRKDRPSMLQKWFGRGKAAELSTTQPAEMPATEPPATEQ